MALDMRRSCVSIETHSQTIFKMWTDGGFGRSEVAPILHQIKELSKAFTSLSISFSRRVPNGATHQCAKVASYDRKRCSWINMTP